jgi:hypothetical protein
MITFFTIDPCMIFGDDVTNRDLLMATEADCMFEKPKPGSTVPNVINMVH